MVSDDVELTLAWNDIVTPGRRSAEVLAGLVGRHREGHRRYHGVRHVVWVLRHVRALVAAIPECHEEAPEVAFDHGAVLAAAFFHDAVYDGTRTDNEARSAQLAWRELGDLGWPERRVSVVAELVLATAGHLDDIDPPTVASALEVAVLVDADLAVLGSDPAAYLAYAQGVRVEYGHIADAEWVIGRGAVLQRLLARPTLYLTAPGRQWWEHTARSNMTAERAGLETLSRDE